jgi:ADP-ribose pyrophosphatase
MRLIEEEAILPSGPEPFVWVMRQHWELRYAEDYAEGTQGEANQVPFHYEAAMRRRLDAVVVVPHFQRDGLVWVVLRSSLRPAVASRPMAQRPWQEAESLGHLWELPAGLVEADELSLDGLVRAACRELFEETGLLVNHDQMQTLGPSGFPAPGLVGERHHFFHCVVSWPPPAEPTADGSALEHGAKLVAVPFAQALLAAEAGELEDTKSELALRRLLSHLG